MGKFRQTDRAAQLGVSTAESKKIDLAIKRRRKVNLKKARVISKNADGSGSGGDAVMVPMKAAKGAKGKEAFESKSSFAKLNTMINHKKGRDPKASGAGNKKAGKKTLPMALRSSNHVPDRVKAKRVNDFAQQIVKIKEAIKDDTLSQKSTLVEWLRALRNSYNAGRMPPLEEQQLTALKEPPFNFNWLHATFKEGPFRKSLGVRVQGAWSLERLRTDKWMLRQQQLFETGHLPQWAADEIGKLLNSAK